ncbi:hypothetical protein AA0Z99_08545 [Agrococcus sp. 1P02AA]|uniref:hypothetical protein n=1 Tax=Agrococcus sp. 1P02AA TaxID=3132259 RepID=UPI0039A50C08
MTIYTLDNGVEYQVAECPLCELRAPRVRAWDGLLHCHRCDMMWRETPTAAARPAAHAPTGSRRPHAA